MKKYSKFLFGTLLFFVVALLVFSDRNHIAAQNQQKPTVVPAEILTPADTPSDTREIAILTLIIKSSDDGKFENVELQQGRIVRSFAPNVLNRSGDWTIEVVGDEGLIYGVSDPRRMNVYGGENETPHETAFLTTVEWELVVPLYLFDKDLNAAEINIYDQDGQLIFSTIVDRDNWIRQ